MSKQWNQVSSITKESTLLEVMSEQFSNSLQVDEDFVWVEMPEAVQEVRRTSNLRQSEVKIEDPLQTSADVTNVVQYATDNADVDEKLSEALIYTDYDTYSDFDSDILPDDEEFIETEYFNQCLRNRDKTINPRKTKYRKPFQMKLKKHDTFSTENRQFSKQNNDKDNSKEQNIKELLPNMKFDASTTAVLEMLIKNRYLGRYYELVGRGKNSVVFLADYHKNRCITMPQYCAVKIYKTSKEEEKNKLIYRKVQREFKHISMACYRCRNIPFPIRAWKNVIVMGFVGCNKFKVQDHSFLQQYRLIPIQEAPQEKDRILYFAIVRFMKECYNTIQLVHGKLIASNIYYWWDTPTFIGWSHSVKKDHPQALTKLIKDCYYVTEFYIKRGVKVMPLKDLFKKITMQEPSEQLLEVIYGKDLYSKYDTNPNRRTNWKKPTVKNRF